MVKPSLTHEHNYEVNLIQTEIRVWFRVWFRIIQCLIESLNESLNQRTSEQNLTCADSESVLNCFWKTSGFSTELLWKLGTGMFCHIYPISLIWWSHAIVAYQATHYAMKISPLGISIPNTLLISYSVKWWIYLLFLGGRGSSFFSKRLVPTWWIKHFLLQFSTTSPIYTCLPNSRVEFTCVGNVVSVSKERHHES